jgi:hypothetical protein
MIVTVAWWDNLEKLVNDVAVHCMAASIRATGCSDAIILIINDARKLPQSYLKLLTALQVQVVGIDGMAQIINSKFPALSRFSYYERACFARWWFIREFLQQHHPSQKEVLVVDGDILFFVSPTELQRSFNGRTFVTGSPALAFSSDASTWLNQYLEGLNEFCRDIEGFSKKLCEDKEAKIKAVHAQKIECSGWDRNPLGSDQDLICALIANQMLRQDYILDRQSQYQWAMSDHPGWFFYQVIRSSVKPPVRLKITSENIPIFWANDSKVTHLHFQSDFVGHCTSILAHLLRPSAGSLRPVPGVFRSSTESFYWNCTSPQQVANPVVQIPAPGSAFYYPGARLNRMDLYSQIREAQEIIHKGLILSNASRELMDQYFRITPATFSLRDIFCSKTWWTTEVPFSWEDPYGSQ